MQKLVWQAKPTAVLHSIGSESRETLNTSDGHLRQLLGASGIKPWAPDRNSEHTLERNCLRYNRQAQCRLSGTALFKPGAYWDGAEPTSFAP